MRRRLLAIVALLAASLAPARGEAQGTGARPSTRRPSVRVVADSFPMPQLGGRTRRVWVYLPPGYETERRRRYPVLYVHDGQNAFDQATSFAGEWGIDETLDSLHALGDPGVIVVAVDNGAERRLDEYNPWKAREVRHGGGEGRAYIGWMVETLKPWIDRRYRTRTDAASTGIMGSSLGGLISLYAVLEHPRVFGTAAVFSCACWIAPEVYALARAARPRPWPRIWLAAGAFETPDAEPARDQRRMVDTLRAAGFPRAAVRDTIVADGKHSEWFWRREFAPAYRWMFRREGRRRGGD